MPQSTAKHAINREKEAPRCMVGLDARMWTQITVPS